MQKDYNIEKAIQRKAPGLIWPRYLNLVKDEEHALALQKLFPTTLEQWMTEHKDDLAKNSPKRSASIATDTALTRRRHKQPVELDK